MTRPAALEARSLCVEIDGARLLHEVDFAAHAGRVHALIGPNGAGKSTLLAALSGDLPAASGEVRLGDAPLAGRSPKALARERAVLTQDHRVSFPFPVREVVAMGRHPWARSPEAELDDAIVDDALAVTDVSHLAHRTVPSLSGGERARVALARVLAQRTPVLMLDEPTAALDLKHQEDVLRLARSHAQRGDTVLVVLHDLNLAAAYADDITLLRGGRVVATGAPAEVLTAERIEAVYGQAVEVLPHPSTGVPLVLPIR
ncbi:MULTISPECIES: heme ABC transporter ATP-binding protein [Agromyces]|uniref:heme ABC transporter ATP-binding protein n=1 Tax=Agromyces TaxID=33877 RepID=UPI001E5E9AA6|nr:MULTISPECIES: heme ABC transporter ATP-binding protein [Agromyces]MCD1572942.1 heme ABC transporter ATP-binding protein [Agromyces mediolanus]GLU88563.1 hemin import ATP-binding protein HmuV [Agromyces sp. NBRC 114283]